MVIEPSDKVDFPESYHISEAFYLSDLFVSCPEQFRSIVGKL